MYLSQRKHYAEIDPTTKTSLEQVNCGVPKRSVLAPLLFLSRVKNLKIVSTLLDQIMFADDTNLFYRTE